MLQVRLNLLSTLLDEAFDHLHQHLCASVLGRRILTLPFHRDVQLTVQQAHAMHTCLNYCQQARGLCGRSTCLPARNAKQRP